MPESNDDRKQTTGNERANTSDRQDRQRRSGEGSQSALANLKHMERDREKERPAEDTGPK